MSEPEPDFSEPPWEQPGAVRRDCDIARGRDLYALAGLSVVLSAFAMCGGFAGIIALPLSVWIWITACQDLRTTHSELGPDGEARTVRARHNATQAVALSAAWLIVWGMVWFQILVK
jgi:hypothetical protein